MTDVVLDTLWKISWQAGALAVVVWIVTKLTPKAPARFRYALWTLVLIKFLVPPFVHLPSTAANVSKSEKSVPPVPMTVEPTPYATPTATTTASAASGASNREMTYVSAPSMLDLMLTAWLIGIGVMSLAILGRWLMQIWLTSQSTTADTKLIDLLALAAKKMQLTKLPAIRYSDRVSTPMLIGVTQPTILLPAGISDHCSETDLEAMLLHELAHIKRKDMLVMWLHQIVMIPFFFHPALWLAGKELKRERELACDEMVLHESGIDRKDYASGYVSALKMANASTKVPAALAMAEPFEVEKRRLDRILHSPLGRRTIWSAVGLLIIAVVGIPTIAGMTKKQPVADKANQRLVKPDDAKWLVLGESDMPGPVILLDLKSERNEMHEVWSESPNKSGRISIRAVIYSSPVEAELNAERAVQGTEHGMMDVTGKYPYKTYADKAWFGPFGEGASGRFWIHFVRGNVVCDIERCNDTLISSLGMDDVARRLSDRVDAVLAGKPMPVEKFLPSIAVRNITLKDAWAVKYKQSRLSNAEGYEPNADLVAGLTAVQGPGVIVTLRDGKTPQPPVEPQILQEMMIHDSDIQRLVNELKSAGAEAVSINGQRIVATTAIRCVGPTIMVNNTRMASPFVVMAIGDPNALEQAVLARGGFVDSFSDKGMVTTSRFKKVKVPAYSGDTRFRWAKPAE